MNILNKNMEQYIRKNINSIISKKLLDIEVLYNGLNLKKISDEGTYRIITNKKDNNFNILLSYKKRKLQNILNPLLEESFILNKKEQSIGNKKDYIHNIKISIPYSITPLISTNSQKDISYKVYSKIIFIDFNQKIINGTFVESYIQKNNNSFVKIGERIINTIGILNIFMRINFYEGKGKQLYQINDNNGDGLHTLSTKDILEYLERKIYYFLYDFKV